MVKKNKALKVLWGCHDLFTYEKEDHLILYKSNYDYIKKEFKWGDPESLVIPLSFAFQWTVTNIHPAFDERVTGVSPEEIFYIFDDLLVKEFLLAKKSLEAEP